VRGPDGELRVRVAAPAVGGKANKRLVSFLARCLEVPPSRVVILQGGSNRHKLVQVEGLTPDEVRERLSRFGVAE
jgi:uncharacterized protein (TIGR00251 family)